MNLQILENKEFGKIRVQTHNGEPWFVAKDVCDVLGLVNSRKAVGDLEDYQKSDVTISDVRSENGVIQRRNMKTINESGLYQLIFQSRKPAAKAFQKWVTTQVLPSIRRTGSYTLDIPPSIHVNNHLCHSYQHWCLRHGYSVRSGQYSKRIRRRPEHFVKHNHLWYISQDYGQALLAYRKSVRRMEQAAPLSQMLLFKTENQKIS